MDEKGIIMRRMRSVDANEFMAFVQERGESLDHRRVGQMVCYTDAGVWPDNLVASFVPAGAGRQRDGGWRIAIEEDE